MESKTQSVMKGDSWALTRLLALEKSYALQPTWIF